MNGLEASERDIKLLVMKSPLTLALLVKKLQWIGLPDCLQLWMDTIQKDTVDCKEIELFFINCQGKLFVSSVILRERLKRA
jgi:hypothetical protein